MGNTKSPTSVVKGNKGPFAVRPVKISLNGQPLTATQVWHKGPPPDLEKCQIEPVVTNGPDCAGWGVYLADGESLGVLCSLHASSDLAFASF